MSNTTNGLMHGGCEICQCYVPEGRQICKSCEDATTFSSLDKTPDGVVRKHRPAIVRAAKARTAKEADLLAVQEIASTGLAFLLTQVHTPGNEVPGLGMQNQLVRAIAETRVLVERLAIIHCASAQNADAYRFYLAEAAKQADPALQAKR